jgi:excisionase family DNA binding protein
MTTPSIPTPPWTCARLAALYGVRTETVWRWCREGRIKAIKIGRSYYIPEHVATVFCDTRSGRRQS